MASHLDVHSEPCVCGGRAVWRGSSQTCDNHPCMFYASPTLLDLVRPGRRAVLAYALERYPIGILPAGTSGVVTYADPMCVSFLPDDPALRAPFAAFNGDLRTSPGEADFYAEDDTSADYSDWDARRVFLRHAAAIA